MNSGIPANFYRCRTMTEEKKKKAELRLKYCNKTELRLKATA